MKRNDEYLKGNKFAVGNKPNKTAFKKGNTPWNKEMKGIHLSPASEFKKGMKPHNIMSIGDTTIRTDKNNKQRRFIKIEEPNKWIDYGKFVWLKNGGLLPKGLILHHLDKNPLNDDIKNLALVTRGGHINLHREDLRKKNKGLS